MDIMKRLKDRIETNYKIPIKVTPDICNNPEVEPHNVSEDSDEELAEFEE